MHTRGLSLCRDDWAAGWPQGLKVTVLSSSLCRSSWASRQRGVLQIPVGCLRPQAPSSADERKWQSRRSGPLFPKPTSDSSAGPRQQPGHLLSWQPRQCSAEPTPRLLGSPLCSGCLWADALASELGCYFIPCSRDVLPSGFLTSSLMRVRNILTLGDNGGQRSLAGYSRRGLKESDTT